MSGSGNASPPSQARRADFGVGVCHSSSLPVADEGVFWPNGTVLHGPAVEADTICGEVHAVPEVCSPSFLLYTRVPGCCTSPTTVVYASRLPTARRRGQRPSSRFGTPPPSRQIPKPESPGTEPAKRWSTRLHIVARSPPYVAPSCLGRVDPLEKGSLRFRTCEEQSS